jgi:hypothetical protein
MRLSLLQQQLLPSNAAAAYLSTHGCMCLALLWLLHTAHGNQQNKESTYTKHTAPALPHLLLRALLLLCCAIKQW